MKRSLMLAAPLVLVVSMAQASSWFPYTSHLDLDEISTTDTSFNSMLAREYQSFATFEARQMYDWPDADYFAEKALMANRGETVMPENPDDWRIPAAHMGELQAARADLNSALDEGGREKIPNVAARAQAKFDCWVEQQEENHQPDHIAACRDEFFVSLGKMKEAMAEKQTAAAPAAPAVAKLGQEVKRMVVRFDWDDAKVDSSGQSQIDALVKEIQNMQDTVLFVEGHADRSGSEKYNVSLSQSRAQNVRDLLISQGLNVGKLEDFKLVAKGENDPAVQTADGIKEPANRRVEIVVRGLVPAGGTSAQATE